MQFSSLITAIALLVFTPVSAMAYATSTMPSQPVQAISSPDKTPRLAQYVYNCRAQSASGAWGAGVGATPDIACSYALSYCRANNPYNYTYPCYVTKWW